MQTRKSPKRHPQDAAPISDVLNASSLASIVQKAQQISRADHLLAKALPQNFAPYCRVMNLKENKLLIEVSSSSIATQLRYRQADLLKDLKAYPEFKHITQIQLVIRPTNRSGT